jgi:hypothetical protein
LLLDQLRAFPFAAHDDGPDALEMAVHVSGIRRNRFVVTDPFSGHVYYDSEWDR